MAFDWRRFLEHHRIPYIEKGSNVSRGNVAIKCPFCADDPSMHLAIGLNGQGYRCWRDSAHNGMNAAYLVRALLRVSPEEARRIVYGEAAYVPTKDQFAELLAKIKGLDDRNDRIVELEFPPDWKPLYQEKPGISPARALIYGYLAERGYPRHDAEAMAQRFDLHYALKGGWMKRVIFPVRDQNGKVVNATGRAIYKQAAIRYKTIARDEAIWHMDDCLLDYHTLMKIKGKVLVVCEGPFDAMRITWIGEAFGIYATCIFTQNVSEGQADKLRRLALNFERAAILFDRGAELQAQRAQFALGFERFTIPDLPKVKDPGDLTGLQALNLCRSWLN